MLRVIVVCAVQVGALAVGVKLLFALSHVGLGATSAFWLRELASSAIVGGGVALFVALVLTVVIVLPLLLMANRGGSAT